MENKAARIRDTKPWMSSWPRASVLNLWSTKADKLRVSDFFGFLVKKTKLNSCEKLSKNGFNVCFLK